MPNNVAGMPNWAKTTKEPLTYSSMSRIATMQE